MVCRMDVVGIVGIWNFEFLVLGFRFSVISFWLSVLGSQFSVFGFRFSVVSSGLSVFGSRFSGWILGFPNKEFRLWTLNVRLSTLGRLDFLMG